VAAPKEVLKALPRLWGPNWDKGVGMLRATFHDFQQLNFVQIISPSSIVSDVIPAAAASYFSCFMFHSVNKLILAKECYFTTCKLSKQSHVHTHTNWFQTCKKKSSQDKETCKKKKREIWNWFNLLCYLVISWDKTTIGQNKFKDHKVPYEI
jgi:hypothetical protein